MANETLNLITDRTAEDVERWKELRDKGFQNMTTEERAEWLGQMKGRYSYTDMNRVESAVKVVAERMVEDGYLAHPIVKTNWTRTDLPTRDDMVRYYGNVSLLRSLLTVYPTTPTVPTVGKKLTYELANDLEQILLDLNTIINNMENGRYYAGELYLGEV